MCNIFWPSNATGRQTSRSGIEPVSMRRLALGPAAEVGPRGQPAAGRASAAVGRPSCFRGPPRPRRWDPRLGHVSALPRPVAVTRERHRWWGDPAGDQAGSNDDRALLARLCCRGRGRGAEGSRPDHARRWMVWCTTYQGRCLAESSLSTIAYHNIRVPPTPRRSPCRAAACHRASLVGAGGVMGGRLWGGAASDVGDRGDRGTRRQPTPTLSPSLSPVAAPGTSYVSTDRGRTWTSG